MPPTGFSPDQSKDSAEENIGPYYVKYSPALKNTGMISLPRHSNNMGSVHGGVLMTFADFSFCAFARDGSTDAHILTVSLTTNFVHAAPVNAWLIGDGEIVRRTRSLVFVRGSLYHENEILLTYNGVGKRIFQKNQ